MSGYSEAAGGHYEFFLQQTSIEGFANVKLDQETDRKTDNSNIM